MVQRPRLRPPLKTGCHPGRSGGLKLSAYRCGLQRARRGDFEPRGGSRAFSAAHRAIFGEAAEIASQRWRAAPARPRASTRVHGAAAARPAAARGRRRAAARRRAAGRRAAARAARRRAARSATARASASRARPAAGTTAASGSSSRRVLPRPLTHFLGWGCSSVAERPLCMRKAQGSNPCSSTNTHLTPWRNG